MNVDTKAVVLAIAIVFFEFWNISQAKKSGFVLLGLLLIRKKKENNDFQVALIGNIVWTIFVLIFIMHYAYNVLHR